MRSALADLDIDDIFGPEILTQMQQVFDATCRELGGAGNEPRIRRAIAVAIVQHYELGIRSPLAVTASAVNTGRSARGHTPQGPLVWWKPDTVQAAA
ncbi:hypothetical protein [Phreatobacter stygius]|uniref:Uncharacterized protein n=1 Tax=Phreatobacter stygius TaxID=1940610 RepID=A0A4D7B0P6_9HYPH|nr:hypothetical protein [Phreatobacter stygius]QCI67239.1 hypothetical protein E8M01_25195 [Phreatobacter stygius]